MSMKRQIVKVSLTREQMDWLKSLCEVYGGESQSSVMRRCLTEFAKRKDKQMQIFEQALAVMRDSKAGEV